MDLHNTEWVYGSVDLVFLSETSDRLLAFSAAMTTTTDRTATGQIEFHLVLSSNENKYYCTPTRKIHGPLHFKNISLPKHFVKFKVQLRLLAHEPAQRLRKQRPTMPRIVPTQPKLKTYVNRECSRALCIILFANGSPLAGSLRLIHHSS